MDYIIYSSEYEQKAIELLNSCFLEKNITPHSFRWKYTSPFFCGKEKIMIAVENNTLCSFVCFSPIQISKNNTQTEFYVCSVQATHVEHRRKGLVSTLTKKIEDSLSRDQKYIGFSNKNGVSIDKYSSTIGYEILGAFTRSIIFSPLSLFQKSNIYLVPIELQDISHILSEKYGIYYSSEYINWKYIQNIKHQYKAINIFYKGENIGYCIYEVKRLFLDIVTLKILPKFDNSQDMISEIWKAIMKHSLFQGKILISYVSFLNKKTPYTVIKKNIDMYLTVKSNVSDLLKTEQWQMFYGDIQ